MSLPNIPDITPEINLSRKKVISLLLASIALEEIGLSHIINAEAEKIQHVLKDKHISLCDLLEINRSVEITLRSVIKQEMLLQFKLEDVLRLLCSKEKCEDCEEECKDDYDECDEDSPECDEE